MAFSPTDPATAHSLWLQSRSTRRKPPHGRWRNDWTAVWVPLLLLTILGICYGIMPANNAVRHAEQSAEIEPVLQDSPVVGALGP